VKLGLEDEDGVLGSGGKEVVIVGGSFGGGGGGLIGVVGSGDGAWADGGVFVPACCFVVVWSSLM